ncbi:MAG: hypothetical protein A3H97_05020 [Acidobacteria bacterium RIFCSPLOWO2_02_FULL_65_29]|nr:MAG: hypothetical protein A3H97_05020 [Acidobacteria bacterium RIFCSPLOWO2_02_FULL_65_29]
MSLWKQWLQQPQRVWLRRALFQIHLWTGLALGLYIVVLSVTGSALVYRRELVALLRTPIPQVDPSARRLSIDELRAAAERRYPDHEITDLREAITRQTAVAHVTVERSAETKERLFNPYTGEDLGDAFTRGERALLWNVRLHDDLLFGSSGRYWNGVASAFVTVLCLTGAIVWWPGVNRWRRSLMVNSQSGWRRLTWDLHSAMGAWLFLFILMWGVSGFYMGIPEPFTAFVDYVSDPNPELLGERPGDLALAWLSRLHFGRWQSGSLKALWALIGFAPAIMFMTGAIMWWNRVVRKRPARNVAESALTEPLAQR